MVLCRGEIPGSNSEKDVPACSRGVSSSVGAFDGFLTDYRIQGETFMQMQGFTLGFNSKTIIFGFVTLKPGMP